MLVPPISFLGAFFGFLLGIAYITALPSAFNAWDNWMLLTGSSTVICSIVATLLNREIEEKNNEGIKMNGLIANAA